MQTSSIEKRASRPRTFVAAGALAAAVLLSGGLATGAAATELLEVHVSADIHTTLPAVGGGNLVTGDDAIIVYTLATGQADGFLLLGELDRSDIDAYAAPDACGPSLFSLNSTATIAGTVMRPADVFREVGLKVLDAAGEGIADGVDLDAVSRDPGTCDLVVSFDVTVELDGSVFRPDDLVRFSGGAFSLFRQGPGSGNVDAVHVLDTGSVLASFAAPVPELGIAFSDQDVVEQASDGGSWTLAFQPAQIDASWDPADTDALHVVRAPIAGDFRWATPAVEVLEGQGSVGVDIQRLGLAEGPVTVNWSTADGTALAGIDYGGSSGGTAFSDGQLSGVVPLTLFDDGAVDGDKFFYVDLVSATNGGVLVNPTRLTVLIRDDEDFLFADGFED